MDTELHERLDKIDSKVDKLTETVAKIAVQDQRLSALEDDTKTLFIKTEALSLYQASCPRNVWGKQLTAMWVFISGIVLFLFRDIFQRGG